jgi:hypothetical protein
LFIANEHHCEYQRRRQASVEEACARADDAEEAEASLHSVCQDPDDDVLQRLCEEGAIDEGILRRAGEDVVSTQTDEQFCGRTWEVTKQCNTEWFLLCSEENAESLGMPTDDADSADCFRHEMSGSTCLVEDDWQDNADWESPHEIECFVLSEGEDDDHITHEDPGVTDHCNITDAEDLEACDLHVFTEVSIDAEDLEIDVIGSTMWTTLAP